MNVIARYDPVAGCEPRPELPDYLRPGLKVVFVGFNPGDRSSRIGHYYAGRGNQFWSLLRESGLVTVPLRPEDDRRLLEFGIGVTDLVKRWSRSSSELRREDYRLGIPLLREKLERAAPLAVAFNGKGAYQQYCGRLADLGLQPHRIGRASVFVLPSTSGRNGSLTRAGKLAHFRRLARWVRRYA
ncbi:MAG TPA: mismatch-specific DNA-glycosylase [Terriglobia bacterium]|nr:mismatch-specific DNA-glycosylase [Terriglobia bacterium]